MTGSSRSAQVLLAAYLVLAFLEQFSGAWHWQVLDSVLLALLMPVLAGFVLTARSARGRLTTLAVFALAFSWLGDTVGGVGLLIKIGLFVAAQAIYAVAFWPYRRSSVLYRPPLLVLYLVCLTAAIALAAGLAGSFLPAVLVYGCALGLMAMLASGLNRSAAVGGILFVISDLSLSVGLFDTGRLADALQWVVMPSYLIAQLLLVRGMVAAQAAATLSEGSPAPGRSPEAVSLDR